MNDILNEQSRTRAALDAYSEVVAERGDRMFRNGDHERAIKAALMAADEHSLPVRALQQLVRLVFKDEAILAELRMGAGLGDFPVRVRQAMGENLFTRIALLNEREDKAKAQKELNAQQRETLTIVEKQSPLYRGAICPKHRVNASSAQSLVRRGYLAKRTLPVDGYQLTDLGRNALATNPEEAN